MFQLRRGVGWFVAASVAAILVASPSEAAWVDLYLAGPHGADPVWHVIPDASLAIDANGNYVVAWYDGRNIKVKYHTGSAYRTDLITLDGEMYPGGGGFQYDKYSPSVAVAPNGDICVAYLYAQPLGGPCGKVLYFKYLIGVNSGGIRTWEMYPHHWITCDGIFNAFDWAWGPTPAYEADRTYHFDEALGPDEDAVDDAEAALQVVRVSNGWSFTLAYEFSFDHNMSAEAWNDHFPGVPYHEWLYRTAVCSVVISDAGQTVTWKVIWSSGDYDKSPEGQPLWFDDASHPYVSTAPRISSGVADGSPVVAYDICTSVEIIDKLKCWQGDDPNNAPLEVVGPPVAYGEHPQLAVTNTTGAARLHVVYNKNVDGYSRVVYKSKDRTATTWSGETTVAGATGANYYVAAAGGGQGAYHVPYVVVWQPAQDWAHGYLYWGSSVLAHICPKGEPCTAQDWFGDKVTVRNGQVRHLVCYVSKYGRYDIPSQMTEAVRTGP